MQKKMDVLVKAKDELTLEARGESQILTAVYEFYLERVKECQEAMEREASRKGDCDAILRAFGLSEDEITNSWVRVSKEGGGNSPKDFTGTGSNLDEIDNFSGSSSEEIDNLSVDEALSPRAIPLDEHARREDRPVPPNLGSGERLQNNKTYSFARIAAALLTAALATRFAIPPTYKWIRTKLSPSAKV